MNARRILGLGFFLPAQACASSGADGDAAFIALENQWVEAIQKHDTIALDVLTGPRDSGELFSIFNSSKRDSFLRDQVFAGGP